MKWPYSDEVTAGIETQLPGAIRFGAMYYMRSNRNTIGQRNVGQPTSAYTPFTVQVPNGPGGTLANPKPTTITVYNVAASVNSLVDNVRDNQDYLDTTYHGVEFTATKRLSRNWQMQAGYTLGRNRGGVINVPNATDLNDPNNTNFAEGILGNDSVHAFRLSGSYNLPWDISLAGSMIANGGYPFQSTYVVTRAAAATQGVTLTRASQTIALSERGKERFGAVRMFDLRLSKNFRFGTRSISPQVDFFNITNIDETVAQTNAVGSSYLFPSEIIAPRIIRVGLAINF